MESRIPKRMLRPDQNLQRRAYNAAYHAAHKEKADEYQKLYRVTHRAEILASREGHKEQWAADRRTRQTMDMMDAFNAYGGARCACCGETLLDGLTMDHINGDGAEHIREIGGRGGHNLYRWLKKNNYPPGFQVLCGTCNFAKGTGDHCPHQDMWL